MEGATTSYSSSMPLPYLDGTSGSRHRVQGRAQPHSARAPREDRTSLLTRDEETIRQVYKKHAQTFFEEVKSSFQKELDKLRKQSQKAIAKASTYQWPDHNDLPLPNSESLGPQVFEVQVQLSDLHRQFQELKAAANHGLKAQANVDSEIDLQENVVALAKSVARQREELRLLAKHVRTETTLTKKASTSSFWKERTLEDIAHVELQALCADEVNKAFQKFKGLPPMDQMTIDAAVARSLEGSSKVRSELRRLGNDVSARLNETSCRADENLAEQAAIVERLTAIEDRQDYFEQQVAQYQKTTSTFAERLGHCEDSGIHIEDMASELVDRLDGFEALSRSVSHNPSRRASFSHSRRNSTEQTTRPLDDPIQNLVTYFEAPVEDYALNEDLLKVTALVQQLMDQVDSIGSHAVAAATANAESADLQAARVEDLAKSLNSPQVSDQLCELRHEVQSLRSQVSLLRIPPGNQLASPDEDDVIVWFTDEQEALRASSVSSSARESTESPAPSVCLAFVTDFAS